MTLIVIDGLDASGKSTQARALCRFLRNSGKTVCLRIHPANDNIFGVKAKAFLYLRGKSAHFCSALFYMLDVIHSILLYSWRGYDYVIFVRYLMGTAYLPSPLHLIAYHFFSSIVPRSNAMFFLDTSPEEANRRLRKGRRKREMFENIDALKKIRAKALSLAMMNGWVILDGNKPAGEIEKEIRRSLED